MHTHHDHSASSRIAMAFFLNLGFAVIEFVGGWLTNSTAIMADAVHDLGDSLSIGTAWVLDKLGKRDADSDFTYGYRRLSLLGALVNALVLIVGSVWVLSEAIPRLFDPVMPHAGGMIGLAFLGVAVNGFAAWRLSKGNSLNERVLNWHLLEDVLGWIAVLIVAIVMNFVDWPILDPLLSVGFTLFILFNVVRMLRETARLFFQAVPDAYLFNQVQTSLRAMEQVEDVHHLHVWSLDGEHHVLSAHVRATSISTMQDYLALKASISDLLSGLGFASTTIEIELDSEKCRDT